MCGATRKHSFEVTSTCVSSRLLPPIREHSDDVQHFRYTMYVKLINGVSKSTSTNSGYHTVELLHSGETTWSTLARLTVGSHFRDMTDARGFTRVSRESYGNDDALCFGSSADLLVFFKIHNIIT